MVNWTWGEMNVDLILYFGTNFLLSALEVLKNMFSSGKASAKGTFGLDVLYVNLKILVCEIFALPNIFFDFIEPMHNSWRKVFDELDDLRKSFTNAEYYIYSYGRARHEDKQTFINDMPYLAVGFVLLLVYSCLVTFNLKLKGNRLPLTLGGLVSTLLSMSASFGVMISAGVPFVTFSVIIPFVVFGEFLIELKSKFYSYASLLMPNFY